MFTVCVNVYTILDRLLNRVNSKYSFFSVEFLALPISPTVMALYGRTTCTVMGMRQTLGTVPPMGGAIPTVDTAKTLVFHVVRLFTVTSNRSTEHTVSVL